MRTTKIFASVLLVAGLANLAANAALTVKSVGSVRKGTATQVTVVFSAPVDQATGTTLGNYTFSGGVTVTAASLMTGLPAANAVGVVENPAPGGRVVDNECVVLTVTGLAVDATTTITIQNVQDRATPPNTIATTNITFKDSGYAWAESGIPAIAGKVIAIGTNGFDIFSAGSAQWANYDEVVMVYKQVTGDFDFKARVEFQDFSSHWARAGVMARESLNEGQSAATQATTASRYASVHANPVTDFNENGPPPQLHGANNGWESHIRAATGAQTGSANATGGAPPYPNAWVRIQRQGGDIHTFHGSDGVNWDPAADRIDGTDWLDVDGTTPLSLLPTLFVGPSFGPETGNIPSSDTDGKNRLFLYQVRFTAISVPYLRLVDPNPSGVTLLVEDPLTGALLNTATVQLTFDGSPVTPTVNKSGTTTTVAYQAATPFAPNSPHTIVLSFSDTLGGSQSISRDFTTPAYATIPAAYAILTPPTDPGMAARITQIDAVRGPGDPNSIANAEQQLANGLIDPTTGNPYPNVATASSANVNYINWEQDQTDIDPLNPQNGPDNFNSALPTSGPIPNELIPGIPGSSVNEDPTDYIAVEVVTYLQLNAGTYRMGVNSDDGFKVSTAPGAPTPFGLVLGSYGTGRGAANTFFDFVVAANGYYPFRLAWWEGTGGANVEWFTVNLNTGQKLLVNGAGASTLKAFRTGRGRAYVKSLLPANGFTGANTNGLVKVELVDDLTTVVNGSISLSLDGATVTPTVNKVGTTTTVTYSAPGGYAFGSAHTGTLIWTELTVPTPTTWTNNFSFTVRFQGITDLPASSFWIEAEDFNFGGGQTMAIASTMPYPGNAYDQLGATVDIDYQRPQEPSSDLYRIGETPNVPMDGNQTPGTLDTQRPGNFEVSVNYKMGWTANGAWYNYTRTIPAGLYTAFGAFSHGDVAADVGGSLQRVTAGATTTSQTVVPLGTFNGPAPGGWGNNTLVPLRAPTGDMGVFKLPGGPVTLRLTTRNGDYDWFVLAPVTGITPKVTSASPAPNSAVRRDATLNLTIEDFSTAVNLSTVKLFFDGADVTSSATITKPADITTVAYDPPGLMGIASAHTYSLVFSDNGAPVTTQTNSASFTVHIYPTAGSFLIEAEDFNSGGGQHQSVSDTMPYLGGAYTNLGAVLGVDYNDNDGLDSRPYRNQFVTGQNVNHDSNATAGTLDTDRGEWSVTANYKIGWVGSPNWYNYTRNFPANTYQVWAALSFDGTVAGQLHGRLEQVTSDPSQTNQTVAALGTFDAPGSGGWGANNLVQMKDGGGNVAVISLSGVQTVRYNADSGDYDYLMFVPGAPPLRFNAPTRSGGNVIISWTGTGVLQEASNLTGSPGDWSDVAGNPSSPFPVTPGATARKFYRLRQ